MNRVWLYVLAPSAHPVKRPSLLNRLRAAWFRRWAKFITTLATWASGSRE